jgi:hypothetical protein
MARNRRRANARTRLNLEIVGIAAIALAVLSGIALAFPHHAGSIGGWAALELRSLFGAAAPLFPFLVALLGAIVFLEINVPPLMRSSAPAGGNAADRLAPTSGGRCMRSSAASGRRSSFPLPHFHLPCG